jgi:hypothetical protein
MSNTQPGPIAYNVSKKKEKGLQEGEDIRNNPK